jgi:abortive infection bacteriophage resistance protein
MKRNVRDCNITLDAACNRIVKGVCVFQFFINSRCLSRRTNDLALSFVERDSKNKAAVMGVRNSYHILLSLI